MSKQPEVLTATLRVLEKDGRRVTLTEFRQMPRDDEITGEMLGTVNYCHKMFRLQLRNGATERVCYPFTHHGHDHRHVVWSDGTEAYHGIVTRPGQQLIHGPEDPEEHRALWERVLALPHVYVGA